MSVFYVLFINIIIIRNIYYSMQFLVYIVQHVVDLYASEVKYK